jgi:hypothetical protein
MIFYTGGNVMKENDDKIPFTENVSSMCTKCKMAVDHMIISRDAEGIIGKVRCLTCGSEHKYRQAKVKTPRKAARPKKVDPARDFNLLIETFKGKRPQRYSMSGLFKTGDVIDHSTFGTGIVISALNRQMEVVFSDHPRLLVFGRVEMEISR